MVLGRLGGHWVVLPAAFVSLSTTELDELGAWRRLKIFSAGVWHNLVLAAVAYGGLVYVIPMLFAPLFQVFIGYICSAPNIFTIINKY